AVVYHAAGPSVDAAATSALSTANYQTLVRLHPGYFPKVARFIEQNPLGPVHANLRLALRRHGSSAPALLAVLHASFDQPGGGTEHHVRDLLQSLGLPRAVVAVPQADGIHLTEILDGRLDHTVRDRLPLCEPPARYMLERPEITDALRTLIRLFGLRAAGRPAGLCRAPSLRVRGPPSGHAAGRLSIVRYSRPGGPLLPARSEADLRDTARPHGTPAPRRTLPLGGPPEGGVAWGDRLPD